MIATNNTNTSGTADYDLEDYATSDTYTIEYQECSKPPSINIFRLAIWLGAKVGWCNSKYDRACYMILYWKNQTIKHLKPQTSCIHKLFFSGYMSQHRGLHWSRRERYGLK